MSSIITILTPASQLLVSEDVIRSELDIKTGRNSEITRVIASVSQLVAKYTNRVLVAEQVREQFRSRVDYDFGWNLGVRATPPADGSQHDVHDPIQLRRWPVQSMATPTAASPPPGVFPPDPDAPYDQTKYEPLVQGVWVFEDDVELQQQIDYEIDAELAQITRLWNDMPRAWYFRKLEVVYTGGYLPNDLPPALVDAVVRAVTGRLAATGRDPALKQFSIPGVLEQQFWVAPATGPSGLPPEIEASLDFYREVRT